jgi:hypothetical protein
VTVASTALIGSVADRISFQPIIIVASMAPCVAALIMITLVRPPKKPDPSGILRSF